MKITDAKVFVGGPGKNYVTLKIMTDQGVYGLGDATINNRETLPAAYLQDYLIPSLIGMDPRNSEDIWQYFYRGAYFRRGPIAMAAFGAIDMALWDIRRVRSFTRMQLALIWKTCWIQLLTMSIKATKRCECNAAYPACQPLAMRCLIKRGTQPTT